MHLPQIDSTRIKTLVLSRQEGWTNERFEQAFLGYLHFLELALRNPGANIMCPRDIDEIWHMHMLDSVNYVKDCERIFGRYLHHDPCVGPVDMESTKKTLTLYEQAFGEKPGQNWQQMMTCANPCQGCGSIKVD